MYKCRLNTGKEGRYNITAEVKAQVEKNKMKNGLLLIYCPHTTASVVVSENVDVDVKEDILSAYRDAFPKKDEHLHYEGNAYAHIRSTVSGVSVTLMVENGKLILGQFQGIYFMEFDGPRTREYYLKFVGDSNN